MLTLKLLKHSIQFYEEKLQQNHHHTLSHLVRHLHVLFVIRLRLLSMLRREPNILHLREVGSTKQLIHTLQRKLFIQSVIFSNTKDKKAAVLTPFVSGSQNATIAMTAFNDPNTKYAPYGIFVNMIGVVFDTARFMTQCTNDARATLYALSRFVGISDT